MNYKYFLLFCLMTLFFVKKIISVGLRITPDFSTHITLFLDDGKKISKTIEAGKTSLIDVFPAGISSITWIDKNGKLYNAKLNLKWTEGWTSITIDKENIITIFRQNSRIEVIEQ